MSAPISIRGVSRRFGATVALHGVDLEVPADEFVALVGPSGCGKTTLLRIVADLEQPSTGEVRVGADPPAAARRHRMLGLVSQRPAVLPWKRAVDDVAFTQRIARRGGFVPRDLLAEFGLGGRGTRGCGGLPAAPPGARVPGGGGGWVDRRAPPRARLAGVRGGPP